MPKPKNIGNILTSFLASCAEFAHAGAWKGLPASDDIRRPPADPKPVVDQLLQQFSQADLLKAGLLVMDSSESVVLDPRLRDPQTLIVALRKADGEEPFEILTDHGTLSGRELPICASLRDGRIRKLKSATKHNVLFVAPTTPDMAVLLSLKLPATISSGLAHLKEPYLGQVCKRFRLGPPRWNSAKGLDYLDQFKSPPPDLLLVGFSLRELSSQQPPGLADIISHLAAVEEYLHVPLDRFFKWSPSRKEIEGIAFCLTYSSLEKARAAILNELEDCTSQLIGRNHSNGMPQDLPTAIRQMAKQLHARERDRDWERRAWENIQQLLEKACITPMYEAAARTDDPLERNLWMLAAMYGQTLYPQSMQMLFNMMSDSRQKEAGKSIQFSKAEFNQQMSERNGILKTFKEIQECRKNPFKGWKKHHS